ncbi:phosphoesterase [Streptomyces phage BillNye]|uniref:Phosphoesterase n=1 Tax=Streptomyces phage BillNye TaxID=2079426 RepID=A0A2L1IVW7_9CAUD|nr:phosphoesterase [Streptomyces phage BillNye]AVD99293.1 phosphoesterase [Streptomyces phage BillNye]
MKVVTANIRNNPDMLRKKVKADAATVSGLGGVLLFQEIGEPEDHTDVKAAIGTAFTYVHDNVEIPIAFRKSSWNLLDSDVVLMHKGKRMTSPNRYLSWVLLERRSNKQLVCIMNTHFVSGAWNGTPKLNKAWRRERWLEHWKKMSSVVNYFHSQGVTVIFGGDFNRLRVGRFHQDQRWAVNRGIDKIGVLEGHGGVRVKLLGQSHHPLNSDHDAHVASIELHGVVK